MLVLQSLTYVLQRSVVVNLQATGEGIEHMDWSSESLDLDPIEHVWDVLASFLNKEWINI